MVQSTQRGLSPKKIKALSLLLLGATDHFVAREIGVSRSTVWRWCKRDAVFIAEWNRWIDQLSHASGARMAGLLSRAMDEVGRQMGSRRARTRFRAASLIIRIGSRRLPAMPTLQQLDPEQVAASLVKSGVDVRDLEPLEQETTDEHG